jgi:hypothetical protein
LLGYCCVGVVAAIHLGQDALLQCSWWVGFQTRQDDTALRSIQRSEMILLTNEHSKITKQYDYANMILITTIKKCSISSI